MITINVLALDLATKRTGFAIYNFSDKYELLTSGVIESDKNEPFERLIEMKSEVLKLIKISEIDYICIEDVFMSKNNPQNFKLLCILQGIILSICDDLDLGFVKFFPSEWRKLVGMYAEKVTRQELTRKYQKPKAVEMVNQLYNTDYKYSTNSKKTDDDFCEAILIGIAFYNFIQRNDRSGK